MELLRHALKSGVGWGIASLVTRLASAAVLLPLMTRLVPPEQLGFWYLFTSFFAMVVVLDFGITTASARTLADLLSKLESDGTKESRANAAKFLGSSRALYMGLILLTFFGLSVSGGWWIWQQTENLSNARAIRLAWLIACPAFALAVLSNYGRALLYATNQLNVFQFLATCGFTLQAVVAIGGLLMGFGLQALVIANLCMFSIISAGLLAAHLRPGRLALAGQWGHANLGNIRSILNVSAGTFCNTLATYVVLNSNILLASHFISIREIASYGLSLQLILVCSQASAVWLEMKQPLFVHWIRTSPETMRSVFISRLRLTMLTYVATIAATMTIGTYLLDFVGAQTPLLPTGPFLTLAALIFVVMHHSQFETICMCVGHNPFIPAYLISAAAGASLAFIFAGTLGIWAFILGPLVAQLAWNSWWVTHQGLNELQLTSTEYLRRLIVPKWRKHP